MKKAPNKKRETAACGSACLRAAAPPSSLASFLSSFGGCAASFSCPLRASLSSCGRLRRPSSLLLLSRFFRAATPPYPFRFSSASSAAAPPYPFCFSSASSAAAPPLSPRALVGGWRRPLAPLLHYYSSVPKTLPSHVMNFFSFAIIISSLINHCVTYGDVALSRHTEHAPSALALRNVTVLGYTALNFKAFGHKFLSFGKFFLLIRKKFVPL